MAGKSAISELHVSWDAYRESIEQLARLIHESRWKFDQILCLARGGLMPGDICSRIFKVPLAILSTSSYRDDRGTTQGRLDIARHVTTPVGTLTGRILLVDDLADSGATLRGVQSHLQEAFPLVSEVRSAVLWCKKSSMVRPHYCVEWLDGDPWIHQPFEVYDGLSPDQIESTPKLEP